MKEKDQQEQNESDNELITLLWNEHKDQQEWQRHNETQRSNFTNVLLLIAGALITFFPKGANAKPEDWPFPAALCFLGIFGFVAMLKYWERFMHHVRISDRFRQELDRFYEKRKTKPKSFTGLWLEAKREHEKGWTPFPKDRHLMQHHLWLFIFFLFAFVGFWWLGLCRNWW